jgi:excinuclease UvrABC nuclease subunit
MKFNIYILRLNEEIVYVGKSTNFKSRLLSHSKVKAFNNYSLIECATEADMHILEVYLIVMLKPLYNKDCMTSSMPTFELSVDIDNLPIIEYDGAIGKDLMDILEMINKLDDASRKELLVMLIDNLNDEHKEKSI